MRFEGELSSLDIDACAEGVEFSTSDVGNAAAAVIPLDAIWDVIDHLIEIAGPRAFAEGAP